MKKIKNNKYHIFIFTPISTPLKSLNHIFVDHSYEKITGFLGSPNYLHILQFHTYNIKHTDQQSGGFGLCCTDL